MFQEILDKQRKIQVDYFPEFCKLKQETQMLETTRSLIHEIIEVERELNFKHWKKPVLVDEEKVKNELVDVFIFFMNAVNIVGMTEDELFSRTLKKMDINKKRQENGY